mgnify:CR=1 FL=1
MLDGRNRGPMRIAQLGAQIGLDQGIHADLDAARRLRSMQVDTLENDPVVFRCRMHIHRNFTPRMKGNSNEMDRAVEGGLHGGRSLTD